jgi:Raf kinase inhibitor-like YbhB/YbcL family protein
MEEAMKRSIARLLLASATALVCATAPASAQEKLFSMSSTTFKDGQPMPAKVGNSQANEPGSPNCLGENVSPQLSWTNPPADAKSFALLMIDPEGRGGGGVIHWVAYGIPVTVTGFAEGEASKLGPKYVPGKTRAGPSYYRGPCMPPRQTARHYTFILVATDLEPGALPPGLTKEELTDKIAPLTGTRHDKAQTGMVGLYAYAGK